MKKLQFTLAIIISLSFIGPDFSWGQGFADTAGHQFKTAIDYVQSEGIVQGYNDGTFKPDAQINRAEFTKIIVETYYPEDISGSGCFLDVNQGWFAPYICTAKSKGLVQGYPDGTFRPNETISLVEAAKIISETKNPKEYPESDPWYQVYFEEEFNDKLIPTTITNLEQKITRAEMAEFIYRIRGMDLEQKMSITAYMVLFEDELHLAKNNKYLFKDDAVYYLKQEFDHGYEVIVDSQGQNVDLNSFTIINEYFSTDKDDVFCADKQMPDVDYDSLQSINHYLANDKNKLYYQCKIIKDINPADFYLIGSGKYFGYQDRVYSLSTALWNGDYIDTNTLELGMDHALLIGSDPANFELVSDNYCGFSDLVISGSNLYVDGDRKEAVNTNSFELLNDTYFRDADSLFYCGLNIGEGYFELNNVELVDKSPNEPQEEDYLDYYFKDQRIIVDDWVISKGALLTNQELSWFYLQYPEYQQLGFDQKLDTSSWETYDGGFYTIKYPQGYDQHFNEKAAFQDLFYHGDIGSNIMYDINGVSFTQSYSQYFFENPDGDQYMFEFWDGDQFLNKEVIRTFQPKWKISL
jgi:hypothetical protein